MHIIPENLEKKVKGIKIHRDRWSNSTSVRLILFATYIILNGVLIKTFLPELPVENLISALDKGYDLREYSMSKLLGFDSFERLRKALEWGILDSDALTKFETLLKAAEERKLRVRDYVLYKKLGIDKTKFNQIIRWLQSRKYFRNIVDLLSALGEKKSELYEQVYEIIHGSYWIEYETTSIEYEIKLKYVNGEFVPILRVKGEDISPLLDDLVKMLHTAENLGFSDLCSYLLAKNLGLKNVKQLQLFEKFLQKKLQRKIDFFNEHIDLAEIKRYFNEFKESTKNALKNIEQLKNLYQRMITKSRELWITLLTTFLRFMNFSDFIIYLIAKLSIVFEISETALKNLR